MTASLPERFSGEPNSKSGNSYNSRVRKEIIFHSDKLIQPNFGFWNPISYKKVNDTIKYVG